MSMTQPTYINKCISVGESKVIQNINSINKETYHENIIFNQSHEVMRSMVEESIWPESRQVFPRMRTCVLREIVVFFFLKYFAGR